MSGLLYCTPLNESKLQPNLTNQLDIGVRPQAWQLQASQFLTAADDFMEISWTICMSFFLSVKDKSYII